EKARAFMSRREALQVALDCERKAQVFFTEAVKHVRDPEVKRLFEELREEEVVHERLVASELSKLPLDPEVTADDYADEPVAQETFRGRGVVGARLAPARLRSFFPAVTRPGRVPPGPGTAPAPA